jgi:hypothetical protein
VGEGFPSGEELEAGECDGDLGFVVRVLEVDRVLGVEEGGDALVGVKLEGKGFGDGEDLWEEGQLAAQLGAYFAPEESVFVFGEDMVQGLACGKDTSWVGMVVAKPKLGVRSVGTDGEVSVGL